MKWSQLAEQLHLLSPAELAQEVQVLHDGCLCLVQDMIFFLHNQKQPYLVVDNKKEEE